MASLPQYEPPRFIAIEGPIGVGKSSLARILSERLHAALLRDAADNPFLTDFYKSKPGTAFQAQLWFLIQRYKQLQALDLSATASRAVVSDYTFEKDRIFAYLNLSDRELEVYDEYYRLFSEQVPIPDLVIYLQAKLETLKERIRKRKLAYERHISDDYLIEVSKAYEHFFFNSQLSNLLVIETSEIDFVDREKDLQELLARLNQPVKGTQYFLPLGSAPAD